jgi:hypothetical protein
MVQDTYLGAHWRSRCQWGGLLLSGFSLARILPVGVTDGDTSGGDPSSSSMRCPSVAN